jgi:hypothetical protein
VAYLTALFRRTKGVVSDAVSTRALVASARFHLTKLGTLLASNRSDKGECLKLDGNFQRQAGDSWLLINKCTQREMMI